jgi:hypothetical protein
MIFPPGTIISRILSGQSLLCKYAVHKAKFSGRGAEMTSSILSNINKRPFRACYNACSITDAGHL